MTRPQVTIISTGAANIASVQAAFGRLDVETQVTTRAPDIRTASHVVLPGVGAFGDVMARLRASGVADALAERTLAGEPLLAICLGLQLLADGSEEAPGVSGIGVMPCVVRRFSDAVRVPQLGWNRLVADAGGSVQPGYAYFANSYALTDAPDGWVPSWAEYGGRFVAALERGPQLACQFHPELSGDWGAQLLLRWVRAC